MGRAGAAVGRKRKGALVELEDIVVEREDIAESKLQMESGSGGGIVAHGCRAARRSV